MAPHLSRILVLFLLLSLPGVTKTSKQILIKFEEFIICFDDLDKFSWSLFLQKLI